MIWGYHYFWKHPFGGWTNPLWNNMHKSKWLHLPQSSGWKKKETTTQFSMKLKSQISVFTVASRPGKLIQKRKKSHRTTWSCWKSIKQIKKVLRKKKQACQRNFTTLLCFFRIFFSLKGWFGFKSQRFVSVEGWFRSRCHFVFGSLTPRDDAIYPGRIGI